MGLKEKLEYHKKMVKALEETIKFREAVEEKRITKEIFKNDCVIGIDYKNKQLYVSEFTYDLVQYHKDGWIIQKEIWDIKQQNTKMVDLQQKKEIGSKVTRGQVKEMLDYCSVNTYEEALNLINKHKIYTNKVSNKIIKETKV